MEDPSLRTEKIKAVNDEVIVIIGRAKEYLSVGNLTDVFDLYISPDINGLIVGYDWLRRQERIEWDFPEVRMQLGNNGWLKVHDDAKSRCRRIYVKSTSNSLQHKRRPPLSASVIGTDPTRLPVRQRH